MNLGANPSSIYESKKSNNENSAKTKNWKVSVKRKQFVYDQTSLLGSKSSKRFLISKAFYC